MRLCPPMRVRPPRKEKTCLSIPRRIGRFWKFLKRCKRRRKPEPGLMGVRSSGCARSSRMVKPWLKSPDMRKPKGFFGRIGAASSSGVPPFFPRSCCFGVASSGSRGRSARRFNDPSAASSVPPALAPPGLAERCGDPDLRRALGSAFGDPFRRSIPARAGVR